MKTHKKIFYFLILILFTAFIAGCDKPAPTELIGTSQNEDPIEYETIAKSPTDELYSNGTDTTGVSEDLTKYSNVITVSGVKISDNSQTIKFATAQAIFFDRTKPVKTDDGKIIGFKTQLFGEVKFNNVKALTLPFKVKFRNAIQNIQDSTLGFYHLLYSGRSSILRPFNYKYNSSVNFELNPIIGQTSTFDIPTPKEIFANVRITGNKNNLTAKLTWDSGNTDVPIQIVISGKLKGKDKAISLFKLKTRDDGELVIPSKILRAIPENTFEHLIFTLIRQYQKTDTFRLNTLTVLSQSIHSLVVESP